MKSELIARMYKSCSAEMTSKTNEIYPLLLGEGNFNPKVMLLSDYPSAKEEEEEVNFTKEERVKLLPILETLGLTWDDIYATHFIKYRPFKFNRQGKIINREATVEEVDFFRPYIEKEISLLSPKLILTVGEKATSWLMGDQSFKLEAGLDQLYVIGVLGKSYRLYAIHNFSSKVFGECLRQLQENDESRLMDIIHATKTSNAQEEELHVEAEEDQTQEVSAKKEETQESKLRVYEKIPIRENLDKNVAKSYVTVVYGGEGYIDDPTQIALERISSVLTELGIGIHRIDLYKDNYSLTDVFDCLVASKGVVLGICVEWIGIGYRMQKFLDECFFRGSETLFKGKPLFGVSLTRTSYEREAYHQLISAWELLGGVEGASITALVRSSKELETNFDYLYGIDKKTEAYYRILNQDRGYLPLSVRAEKLMIEMPVVTEIGNIEKVSREKITKEKSGLIEDYDSFIEKQHQDIQSISSLLKKKLSGKEAQKQKLLPQILKEAYRGSLEIDTKIQILFDDSSQDNTVIELFQKEIKAFYGQMTQVKVTLSGKKAVLMKVFEGKLTMQRAFMTGEVKAKGDFTIVYKFDELFHFDISK